MAKTKFEIYKDKQGNFRWRLLAQNGEPVASSGEGFKEKRTAMNAVKRLKEWSNTENIVDIEKIKEDAIKLKEKDAKAKIAEKEKAIKAKTSTKASTKKSTSAKSAPTAKSVTTLNKAVTKKVAPKTVSSSNNTKKIEEIGRASCRERVLNLV